MIGDYVILVKCLHPHFININILFILVTDEKRFFGSAFGAI